MSRPDPFASFTRLTNQTARPKAPNQGRYHVAIIGLGGVGSWVAETLARSYPFELTLVDGDDVCVSNINRQAQATLQTVGHMKAQALKNHLESLHDETCIHALEVFVTESTWERLPWREWDLVVDCTDSRQAKAHMIKQNLFHNMPLLVSGSAGGPIKPYGLTTAPLFESKTDPLLRALRKSLRREIGNIKGAGPLCTYFHQKRPEMKTQSCSSNQTLNCNGALGSALYATSTLAQGLSFEVFRHFAIIDEYEN